MRLDAGRRYLLVAAVLLGSYWLAPSGALRGWLQVSISLSSAVAVLVAARLDRPRRGAWIVFSFASLLSAAADGHTVWLIAHGQTPAYPSWSDAGWLSGNLVATAGLLLLQRGRRIDAAGLLDTGVVTGAGGLVLWVALFRPLQGGLDLTELVGILYPVTTIGMLGAAVWLVTSVPAPVEAWATTALTGAVLTGLAGNVLYGMSGGTLNPEHRWFETFYLLMYIGWGYGALRSSSHPARGGSTATWIVSPVRLVTMYGALLVVPGVLMIDYFYDLNLNHLPIATASTVLSLLVPARLWLSMRDVRASTNERDAYRTDLEHQAAHDPLTDLPNRTYVRELLASLMHRAARAGDEVAVVVVDLDFFKKVNEQLGQAAGDEVLRVVAERMKGVLRGGDIVGRQGGDEFVVLIDPVPPPAELMEIAERLVTGVSVPIMTAAGRASVGASVGVALARDGETDAEKLLQDADLAAHRAKANGRGRVEMFDAALRAELEARARVEADIRAGLARGEFELHFQPVMTVAGGQLHSYEALIRWQHPERGLVPPNEFIPLAEESLLICEIGRWVLNSATKQLAAWTHADPRSHGGVTMAVNISARHLASRTLLDEVRHALGESGLEPTRLVLEITETVVLDEPTADAHLRELRALGVAVSLDDFGTGYTSIGQLQNLQVDTLKIDQSFLRSNDEATQALVQLMVTAAHAFRMDVVAEGVETQAQLDRLGEIGCELAQGYFLGRPRPARDIVVGGLSAASG
ncbi:putative bifunctional diguanylate cyclase/phosphodiesterase [Kineosporia succinea]|uniref:Diguanylate cyclase (GGDEF)-like protein n=1 Tax=Kineosporia succinea TaxID=84632 RepID=A0ABT9P967_9ACTN|nr:EAL domain-containing protein [Kineosporia succinea]MDP9828705.1 diguanylate cyclase (GGDEF)-like protein [Kineosporia succinea]